MLIGDSYVETDNFHSNQFKTELLRSIHIFGEIGYIDIYLYSNVLLDQLIDNTDYNKMQKDFEKLHVATTNYITISIR